MAAGSLTVHLLVRVRPETEGRADPPLTPLAQQPSFCTTSRFRSLLDNFCFHLWYHLKREHKKVARYVGQTGGQFLMPVVWWGGFRKFVSRRPSYPEVVEEKNSSNHSCLLDDKEVSDWTKVRVLWIEGHFLWCNLFLLGNNLPWAGVPRTCFHMQCLSYETGARSTLQTICSWSKILDHARTRCGDPLIGWKSLRRHNNMILKKIEYRKSWGYCWGKKKVFNILTNESVWVTHNHVNENSAHNKLTPD